MNPANTQPTESFVFTAYDPYDNIIAENIPDVILSYTPTPGALSSGQVTRTETTVGAKTGIEIEFTTLNAVQTGEIAKIQIPRQDFDLSSEDFLCQQMT